MNDFRPWAPIEGGVLRVQLLDSEPVHSLDVDCVLDLTDFEDVVGVEVLDVTKQLTGGTVEPPSQDSSVRWSYDAEMDALYLHIAEGRGQMQRRSTARGQLDRNGRLVQLDVRLRGGGE
jgi:hypothetical protein